MFVELTVAVLCRLKYRSTQKVAEGNCLSQQDCLFVHKRATSSAIQVLARSNPNFSQVKVGTTQGLLLNSCSTKFLFHLQLTLTELDSDLAMEDEKQKIKDQILYLLKTQGAQTATALAEQLQVSPMAIRQHLQQLKTGQWVTYCEERRPLGRPVKLWQLTTRSTDRFPDSHADLMVDFLKSITTVFGNEGLDQLIANRSHRQVETYRAKLADLAELGWRQQVQGMAQLRTQEGYMAEVVEQPDGALLLVENHCPICVAARTCQQLCVAELDTFRAVFGSAVVVERLEHILQGDRRCAYRVIDNRKEVINSQT